MNQQNAWGGGGGTWASSPGAAIGSYLASGASEGGLQYRYSNESGSGIFRTGTWHGDSYFDNGLGEAYSFIGIAAGNFEVALNQSSDEGSGVLGWIQTGLDILGSTEIPIISQLADLSSAGISLAQGDGAGALMSLGGMIVPGLSQLKIGKQGLKAVKRSESVLGHIFRNALGHVNPSTVTSQNRYINLFEKVANNSANLNPNVLTSFQRTAEGFEGYSQTFRNGRQVWTQTFNGNIINAGVNKIPR